MRWWSVVSRQRIRRERSASNPRMEVDWDRFTDGRVRCLQVGKHYEASIGEVEAAAEAAAKSRGMVACTTYENTPRMRFFESSVWVQFADGEIDPGAPCVSCGEPDPITIHPSFARCPSCGARLLLKRPKGSKRGRPMTAGEGNGHEPGTDVASGDVAAVEEVPVRPKKAAKRAARKKDEQRRGQKVRGLKGKRGAPRSGRSSDL